MKLISNSILKNIVVISIIGILLVLISERLLYIDFIKSYQLSNLNNYFSSIGFILSIITIYLLYINYRHQEKEFSRMNELNKASYKELRKSNELIIVNNQIDYLNSILKEGNLIKYYNMDRASIIGLFENPLHKNKLIYEIKSICNLIKYLQYNIGSVRYNEILKSRIPFQFNRVFYKYISVAKDSFTEEEFKELEENFNYINDSTT